jgi:hypothetical protein
VSLLIKKKINILKFSLHFISIAPYYYYKNNSPKKGAYVFELNRTCKSQQAYMKKDRSKSSKLPKCSNAMAATPTSLDLDPLQV